MVSHLMFHNCKVEDGCIDLMLDEGSTITIMASEFQGKNNLSSYNPDFFSVSYSSFIDVPNPTMSALSNGDYENFSGEIHNSYYENTGPIIYSEAENNNINASNISAINIDSILLSSNHSENSNTHSETTSSIRVNKKFSYSTSKEVVDFIDGN